MALDGVSAIALLILAAFVIERVVSAVLFVFPTLHLLSDPAQVDGAGEKAKLERRTTYLRFFFSAALAAAVLAVWPTLRVVQFFQRPDGLPGWLDPVVTWIVLMGGADRISSFVKLPSGPPPKKDQPLEVTGHLKLDDSRAPR